MRTKHVLAATMLAVGLAVAGCSTNDAGTAGDSPTAPSETTAAEFNDADVTFAQSMIPHHRQAIEMAQMAAERASSAEVKELAGRIEAAQGPEIETMTGWLESWGEDVPDESSGMDGMGHGGMSPDAMMTDEEMDELMGSSGADFDRMFLTMMIKHHEGAIAMAKTEQSEGQNAEAIELAGKIETDQQAEIAEIRKLLAS